MDALPKFSLARILGITKLRPPKEAEEWYLLVGIIIVLIITFMSILAPIISPYDPTQLYAGSSLNPPSPEHPMGTNLLGMDMLSRIIWGGRFLLLISFIP